MPQQFSSKSDSDVENKVQKSIPPSNSLSKIINQIPSLQNKTKPTHHPENETSLVYPNETIVLQTATVDIVNPNTGESLKSRVLFDTGSQRS